MVSHLITQACRFWCLLKAQSLAPLLFLIYINDLEKNIKSNVNFFADDTMLFSVVNNPAISANELNHDIKVISQCGLSVEDEILTLILTNKLHNYYFLVRKIAQITHLFSSMNLLCQKLGLPLDSNYLLRDMSMKKIIKG